MTGGDERCRGKVHGFKFLDEQEQRRLLATADEEVVQAWLAARPHIMFRRITPESEHASVRIPPQLRIRSDSAMGDGSSEEHKSDGWTLVAAKDFAAGEVVLEHTTELFDSNTVTEIIVRSQLPPPPAHRPVLFLLSFFMLSLLLSLPLFLFLFLSLSLSLSLCCFLLLLLCLCTCCRCRFVLRPRSLPTISRPDFFHPTGTPVDTLLRLKSGCGCRPFLRGGNPRPAHVAATRHGHTLTRHRNAHRRTRRRQARVLRLRYFLPALVRALDGDGV